MTQGATSINVPHYDAQAIANATKALTVIGDLALDMTPIIGDAKAIAEAQTKFDYALALVGTLGPAGDGVKALIKEAKVLMEAGDVAKAAEKLGEAERGIVGGNSAGKLIGSVENLTVAEKSFVNEMVAGGKTVEIIPTSTGRTADFFIDGTRYELKTMSNVANQTSDGLSKALSSTIVDARGQSGNIIIDARGQAGMTAEIAERGIGRAFGFDNKTGSKIQSITVITPQGTVYTPRLPQ